MNALLRRTFIAAAAVTGALALAACNGNGGAAASAEGDMTLGNDNAAVTVVEYASVTCGHCAAWNETVWPEFKRKYVDTGKVKYVFREFPTAPAPVAAAGFLLARCAGEERYFEVVDAIFRSQADWQAGTNPRDSLLNIARSVGMNEQEFQRCVSDEDAIAAFEERTQAAIAAGVTGTPAFYVNGEAVQDSSMANLERVIDPLLAQQG
ncbi:DsbA family protein [Brevundimonas sp. 2R-24]|uniref:DsbA family protein n=1 Tax=Peiella sedimenti TaxID=3061083 RepID=A0ABT8SMX8_9CAUL|nr:DsbA family protein [Caulobacteraceae bacterium XZ-24]